MFQILLFRRKILNIVLNLDLYLFLDLLIDFDFDFALVTPHEVNFQFSSKLCRLTHQMPFYAGENRKIIKFQG
jgi:hypothetical protein